MGGGSRMERPTPAPWRGRGGGGGVHLEGVALRAGTSLASREPRPPIERRRGGTPPGGGGICSICRAGGGLAPDPVCPYSVRRSDLARSVPDGEVSRSRWSKCPGTNIAAHEQVSPEPEETPRRGVASVVPAHLGPPSLFHVFHAALGGLVVHSSRLSDLLSLLTRL